MCIREPLAFLVGGRCRLSALANLAQHARAEILSHAGARARSGSGAPRSPSTATHGTGRPRLRETPAGRILGAAVDRWQAATAGSAICRCARLGEARLSRWRRSRRWPCSSAASDRPPGSHARDRQGPTATRPTASTPLPSPSVPASKRPATRPGSPGPATARTAARRFLADYLRLIRGRQSTRTLSDAAPELRRDLRRHPPRATPTQQVRPATIRAVDVTLQGADSVRAIATLQAAGGPPYPLLLYLERRGDSLACHANR